MNSDEKLTPDIQDDDSIIDLLKKLVNESIKYSQHQTKLLNDYIEKKIIKGKFVFRFPFILKEEHIKSFTACIERRLSEIYNEFDLKFEATVEYRNNDKLNYQGEKEFFEATHDEPMLRVYMFWKYKVTEEISGIPILVPYDIIIAYETEQDSDQKELFNLEEWGLIQVEGNSNDWINATLAELKTITKATKMPFWWYYPKKAFLIMREYVNEILRIIALIVVMVIIVPMFFNNKTDNSQFVEQMRLVSDASEKLQAYIEYTLLPAATGKSLVLYYFVVLGASGLLGILLSKFSRYIFPRSAILIGSEKTRQRNILIAYNFIWGAVITSIIGIIISIII